MPKGTKTKKVLPASTPEARENQLINLAMNETERRLRDGSVSSQLLNTLLQAGLTKARLEIEKLRSDLKVSDARIKQMEAQQTSQALFEKALRAFAEYSGSDAEEEYGEDEENLR